jgi:MYXO-CTERM domain-containing protein
VFANGAFPSVSQLLADPADADHLVLRSTFGVLVSRDRGTTWDWICEAGMGYADLEPPMALMPGGAILLAIPQGVSRGDPSGCDFEPAKGIDANVVDLTRIPEEPGSALAVSIAGTVSQLWKSSDDGVSFAPLGPPLDGLIAATVDSAPSDSKVVYVSGIDGTRGVLLRSSDQGHTFESFPVPDTSTGRRPYIAAVAPQDADTVYVRLIGVQGELEVTHDGGKSFTTVLQTSAPVQGFALSPDGTSILASNSYDGTFRASTGDEQFEKVACTGRTCLSWSDSGLFGCGDDVVDGYLIGQSEDRGTTFQGALDLSCIRGPVQCDATTTVGAVCENVWPLVQAQIGALECAPKEVAPYTGCFASGAGGQSDDTGVGGSSSGGVSGRGTGGTNNENGGTTPAPGPSGCDCRAATTHGEHSSFAFGLGLGFVWVARRRRNRSA